MALFEMKFQPGVDKQDTAVGATDRWIDSDNVRSVSYTHLTLPTILRV